MPKVWRFLTITMVGIVLLVTGSVSAQQTPAKPGPGNGLKIAPVRTDLTIDKGSNRVVSLFIENITSSPISLRGVVNDFLPSTDESGEPRIILDENQHAPTNSFKSLVSDVPSVTLQPNERRELHITVTVPPNAASGGYYGAVRFAPAGTENDKNVALTASVGSIFLVRVPGNITEKLSVESFGVAPLTTDENGGHAGKTGTLFSSGPLTIVTRFRNFGNIHVQPFGKMYVKNYRGKIIQTIEINNTQPRGSVLPASIRRFENPITAKKLFGRYTVEASFGYGSDGELLLAQKTFYVIPYKLIGGIILLLVFIIFVLPRLIRKYNESIIRRARQRKKK